MEEIPKACLEFECLARGQQREEGETGAALEELPTEQMREGQPQERQDLISVDWRKRERVG